MLRFILITLSLIMCFTMFLACSDDDTSKDAGSDAVVEASVDEEASVPTEASVVDEGLVAVDEGVAANEAAVPEEDAEVVEPMEAGLSTD